MVNYLTIFIASVQKGYIFIYFIFISSEEDVIRHAAEQINTTKTFEICVLRDNMVERGLKLWKRQKTGSPVNPLKIIFLGEPGVDTGALRKEFLFSV